MRNGPGAGSPVVLDEHPAAILQHAFDDDGEIGPVPAGEELGDHLILVHASDDAGPRALQRVLREPEIGAKLEVLNETPLQPCPLRTRASDGAPGRRQCRGCRPRAAQRGVGHQDGEVGGRVHVAVAQHDIRYPGLAGELGAVQASLRQAQPLSGWHLRRRRAGIERRLLGKVRLGNVGLGNPLLYRYSPASRLRRRAATWSAARSDAAGVARDTGSIAWVTGRSRSAAGRPAYGQSWPAPTAPRRARGPA